MPASPARILLVREGQHTASKLLLLPHSPRPTLAALLSLASNKLRCVRAGTYPAEFHRCPADSPCLP